MSTSLDQKFTADASQIEAVFEKMKRHNQDLLTQLQKLKQEQKQGHDQAVAGESKVNSWLKSNIVDIGKMAAGYFTVQSAISLVSQSYNAWIEQLDKTAEKVKKVNDLVVSAAISTGDVKNANQIEAYTRRAESKQLATGPMAAEVYTGVSRSMSLDAPFERKIKLSEELLKYLPIIAEGEHQDMAALAGKIDRSFGGKKSPGEVMDLALAIRQRAGPRFNEVKDRDFSKGIFGLINTGAETPEQAFAFGITAMNAEQEAGSLERAPDNLRRVIPYKRPTAGQRLTPEDRINNRLSKLNPADRWKLVKSDDAVAKVFFGPDYDNWVQINNDLPASRALAAQALAPGSYADSLLGTAMTQGSVRERASRIKGDARGGEALNTNDIYSIARQKHVKFVEDMNKKYDPAGPDFSNVGAPGLSLDAYSNNATGNQPGLKRILHKEITGYSWIPYEEKQKYLEDQNLTIDAQYEAKREREIPGYADQKAAMKLLVGKIENLIDVLMKNSGLSKATPATPLDVRARGETR